MMKALALLCLVAAAQAHLSWYAVVDTSTVAHVDFRGHFGPKSNLALYVAGNSAAEKLGKNAFNLGPYTEEDSLWVMECGSSEDEKACAGDAEILGRFRVPSLVVIVNNPSTPVSKAALNIISVPPTPAVHKQPHAPKMNATKTDGEPDPLIATFVDAMQRTHMVNIVTTMAAIHTRLSSSSGAVEAQRWIEGQFTNLGMEYKSEQFRAGWSFNVCGELRGKTQPNKLVIFGAHYDCRATNINDNAARAPGADDNASGSSAVLEMARVFASYPRGFQYTTRFCLWSGEEQGLVGSRAYATALKNQGADVVAYLNADMIGYKPSSTPMSFAMMNRFVSPSLTETVNALSRTYLPGVTVGVTSGCCSDQQSFHENGFPAVGYFEVAGSAVTNPNYHRNTDLPATLDFDLVTNIAKACTAAMATLAQPVRA